MALCLPLAVESGLAFRKTESLPGKIDAAPSTRRREVVQARGLMGVVADGEDALLAFVVRAAAVAELSAAAARLLSAGHVVAAALLLDSVVALRAPYRALPLEVLEERDLVGALRVCIVLGAGAPRMPSAAVVRASALVAVMAGHERVRGRRVAQHLPAAAPVRAPAESRVRLQSPPREQGVVALKDCGIGLALDVRMLELAAAADVRAQDSAEVTLAVDLHADGLRNAVFADIADVIALGGDPCAKVAYKLDLGANRALPLLGGRIRVGCRIRFKLRPLDDLSNLRQFHIVSAHQRTDR